MNHPFWLSGRITDPKYLFDREREKSRLRLYLTKGISCQIVGPPSIGKSSLLYNLKHFASEWDHNARVAYLDLQDEACRTVAGIYERIVEEWEMADSATRGGPISPIVKELSKHGLRPVLCLDEFAEVTRRPEEFSIDFFLGLRAIGQTGVTIFTSTRRALYEVIPSYNPTSPFFNIFALLRIGRFSDQTSKEFVEVPREGVPAFSTEERDLILNFANGHPLALQVACSYVLDAKHNGDSLATAIEMAQDEISVRLPKENPT
jgi:uncharacterized protein